MTETTQTATPAVEYYQPKDLLTDKNVRLDPRLDAEFKASVKEHGVLQPVIAVQTADGRIRVRMGHRRVLAAAAAKIQVPVLVIGQEGDDKAEDAARIMAQYAENTHRAALTTRETVALVQDLLDLGVTDAQLRRKTGLSKEQVTAAKTASKSTGALEFADTWQSLTLEQTAVIAEFDGDPEALAELADASGRGQVDHVAQQLRDSAEERAQKKQLLEELTAAGVTMLDSPMYKQQLSYLANEAGERLTAENHAACPGHVAWISQQAVRVAVGATLASGIRAADADLDDEDDYVDGEEDEDEDEDAVEPEMVWRHRWVANYACTDPAANGHADRYGRGGGAKKPEKDAASAERRAVLDGNKAWRAAEKVRRRWLKEFLTRNTPPDGSLRITLSALVGEHHEVRHSIEQGHKLAHELLGLTAPAYGGTRDDLVALIDGSSEARAQVIALGLVLAAYEEHLDVNTWRPPRGGAGSQYYRAAQTHAATYLNLLAVWGYGLSDIESKVAAGVVEKTP
jgi:ParB family chromosome partitioning protein